MEYCICIDLHETNYIFSIHEIYEEAELIAKKVFQITSPPQVFTVAEFIRICDLLNCENIDDSWVNCTKHLESNGIISVGVVELNKVRRLI